ncbi:AAA domain-containing protein [Niallia taxi]|uniref:AAA domain-containing protein n=1 Tax=Niallia taxi TaxID=2499688 RepID=UPI0039826C2A
MKRNIEKIVDSIRNKYQISFTYQQDNTEQFNREVQPYYLFEYKTKQHQKNLFLVGLVRQLNAIRYFNVQKIGSVAIMPIYSTKHAKPFQELIKEQNAFRPENCIPIDVYSEESFGELDYISKQKNEKSDTKLQRLMEYYVEGLRKEQLSDLILDLEIDGFFQPISGDHSLELIEEEGYELKFNNKFVTKYKTWEKQLQKEPELSIHLGYPLQKVGNKKYIPILYFQTLYNIEDNSIKLKNELPYINLKFVDEYTDLKEEEIKAYINDVMQNVKETKDSSGEHQKLIHGGFLFLHKSPITQASFFRELKEIGSSENLSQLPPLQKLLEPDIFLTTHTPYENVYNLVPMNYQQQISVKHSTNCVSLIQGPPGTGKTQTILNLITNAVLRGEKVLVTSTNNKAVDNVHEKLSSYFNGILRVGNTRNREKAAEKLKKELNAAPVQIEADVAYLAKQTKKLADSLADIHWKLNRIDEISSILKDIKSTKNYLEGLLTVSVGSIEEFENEIGIRENQVGLLDKQLNYLQSISANIYKKSAEIHKGFWKFLCKVGIPVEGYLTVKYKKQLQKLGLKTDFLITYNKLDPFHTEVQNYLSSIQHRLLALKEIALLEELKMYNEAQLKDNEKKQQQEKINIDTVILRICDRERKLQFSEEDRLFLSTNKSLENLTNREIFERISSLFPVFLCTNQSVPSCVPLDYKFDLVIIDEASQCTIPSSIPAVKRAKRLTIIGDNLQLNPVVTINERFDEHLLTKYELNKETNKFNKALYSFSKQSIFDVYDNILAQPNKFFLNEHFRCHPDIIEFSNIHFYHKLKILTKEIKADIKGFASINVDTKKLNISYKFKNYENKYEVEQIIHFIDKNFNDIKERSIGIITPLQKQKQYIIKRIKEIAYNNLENCEKQKFYKKLLEEDSIGTVHTFQGRERDIIFFSTVIGHGINQGVVKWINNNANLINVAVTRAVQAFLLVGDLKYLRNSGGILKDLTIYAENKSSIQTKQLVEKSVYQVTNSIYKQKDTNLNLKELLNKGEQKLYFLLANTIKKKYPDLKVNFQMRVCDVLKIHRKKWSRDVFDFAMRSHFDFIIYRQETYEPVAAIEFDGWYHRNDKRTIANDAKKNALCEDADFTLIRIPSTEMLSEEYLMTRLSPYLEHGELVP